MFFASLQVFDFTSLEQFWDGGAEEFPLLTFPFSQPLNFMLPKSSNHGKVSMAAYYGRHAIVPLVKTYVAHGHSSDVTSSDIFNLRSKGFLQAV